MRPDFVVQPNRSDVRENAVAVLGKFRKGESLKREGFASFFVRSSAWCLRFRLIVSATAFLLLGFALPLPGQILITRQEVKHDISPPLRDLAQKAPAAPQEQPHEAEELRLIPLPQGLKPAEVPDPVLQTTRVMSPEAIFSGPTILNSFEGLGQDTSGFSILAAPPDTNGAVGLTQYVQWVNTSFAVFDKSTTQIILGPVNGNTLWTGFGGDCETSNDGDPIVVYDKLANRWVFSQFVVHRGAGPFSQCVAVSTTPDATGTFNRYAFSYSNFDDYPKMGVWPDAYYVTFNMFSSAFLGADVCAYDRTAMLNGQPATQICFQQGSSVGSLLPSDLDGLIPPPTGSPNFVMNFGANALNLYRFHVDFTNPANSTFTGPTMIPVAPFTPLCNGDNGCVPQPLGDGTLLDSLADRLMHRLAYRNFGDHESLVVNHSVAVNPGGGIRWYEIQDPNGTPAVIQQSTFAPDTGFRWMGSIAMDSRGDMALGYSVSSDTVFPSIAIAGRLASDPPNAMGTETSIVAGTGSQERGLTRWGDYSAIQVDPVDDCTFWYTSEYMKTSGRFNWNTRIASFRFPGCGLPDLSVTMTHAGNFTQGQSGANYTITVTNSGGNATDGTTVTVTDTLPAKLIATGASGLGWTCTVGPPVSCNRNDVLASGASYPPITLTVNVAADAPGLVTNSVTVAGGGEKNTLNDTATDVTTVIQQGPDLALTKTHTGPFFFGQTGVYILTATNTGLSATNGSAVTVNDSLPTGISATDVRGTGWTCLPGPPVSCTRSDVLPSGSAYPPITLTVAIAGNAPGSVVNTATVQGGGDTNTLNNTAVDATSIVPAPPDLTITISHTGNFNQSQQSVGYAITITNQGAGPTKGKVTVTDLLPAGLNLVFMSGFGWNCGTNSLSCSRSDVLAPGASYPVLGPTLNVSANAPASVINTATVTGGGDVSAGNNSASDPTVINPSPDLVVAMSHAPDPFVVGQTGAYTITVSNAGHATTSGTVAVSGFLPSGLGLSTISGTGWSCSGTTFSCTRTDPLAAGGSYPPITLTVNVTGGGPGVTSFVKVSGGGEFEPGNDSTTDFTNIVAAILSVSKSHVGNFTAGQQGIYTIVVGNIGTVATSGQVSVDDVLPFGMTAASMSGAGWSCSLTQVLCTRSDPLAPNNKYPPIALTVNVGNTGPTVTNTANAIGGGDSILRFVNDFTTINAPVLHISELHAPLDFTAGQTGMYMITVSNTGSAPTSGTVTVSDRLPRGLTATAIGGSGWNCSPLTQFPLTCTRSDALAAQSSYPVLTLSVNVDGGMPGMFNFADVRGGGDPLGGSVVDSTNVIAPVLTITKTHPGNFNVGQPGTYTITVGNVGRIATVSTVSVTDTLPASGGMTATAMSGAGWNCPAPPFTTLTCTRSDTLPAGASYPPIVLTVNVTNPDLPPGVLVANGATVSGGGDALGNSASDTTVINVPALVITKSHAGNFTVGQPGVYTIKVNNIGTAATTGTVTVSDTLPDGMTATSAGGLGWTCSGTTLVNCTRTDPLTPGNSYPSITLTVSLGAVRPLVFNCASVSGGGDDNISLPHSACDQTIINTLALSIDKSHTAPFITGQSGLYKITVNNVGLLPTAGTVTVTDNLPPGLTATSIIAPGWNCSTVPTTSLICARSDVLAPAAGYPVIALTVSIDPTAPDKVTNTATLSGGGDSSGHTASDPTNIIHGLRFVPVTPCRVADTRNPAGPFGGPFLGGNTTRAFTIPDSACGIPSTALAYSVNVTVVPKAKLAFLTMYPCGQDLPATSTLNSDGRIKAAAAIVPAGANGAACAFTTDDTEFILDINGYFVPGASTPAALAFYSLPPCRVVDTRQATGPLGGPSLVANAARTFPILSSSCNVPSTAQAYSLNFTSVPKAGKLDFLTTWPAGQTQPLVSTLNASTGKVTANAAIVPAGTNGDISVFVTNDSDLVIDINGYFAPPGTGGLSFFPIIPCRARDTRIPSGTPPFTGTLDINIGASGCGTPMAAQSYVLNATVVPPGPLGFLTLWPQGLTQPVVSTLNAGDGAITSNMAIVPTTNGSVSAFVPDPSHLVLDISGFFAP